MSRSLLCSCIGLFFMMFTTEAVSQAEFLVNAGKSVALPKGEFSKLMDYDEQFYYFFRLNDKTQFVFHTDEPPAIEVFDKQLQHVRSIPIAVSVDKKLKKADPVAFFKIDSGFVFLLKSYSPATKTMKSHFFKTGIDGRMEGEILSPVELKDVTAILSNFAFFQLNRLSENGMMRLVFSIKTPPEMDIPERVNLLIFDSDLNRTGERLINFPDDFLNYLFSDIVFGDSGMAFFRVEITNPFLMDKTIHQLIIYNPFTETHQSLEFKFAEGEIAHCDLVKIDDQMAGLFGYYTLNEDDNKILGVYYYLFNLDDGSLINHNICTLDGEALENFNPKNLDSKSAYQHLLPAGIQVTQANHVFLQFEYNWRSMMLIRDQEGKMYNQPVYNANEIFVVEFDNHDRFQHLLVIHKEQTNGFNKSGLGIVGLNAGNDIFVLYNDHPKNMNQYDPKKLKTMKMDYEGVVAQCKFNNSGYIKSRIIASGIPVKLDLTSVFRVSEAGLLFFQNDDGFRLVEICFENR